MTASNVTAPGSDTLTVRPGGCLRGEIRVASDKSISHRSVLFGALASGTSRVRKLLAGEDVMATVAALRALGIEIAQERPDQWRIEGRGLAGLSAPAGDLDLGNSGTAMRLLAGILAAQPFASRLVGDASLSRRPMRRILEPLRAMGARIDAADGDTPPLTIHPADGLQAIEHRPAVASAQVKSCLLLAGLCAGVRVAVDEPGVSRDHSERLLSAMGVPVSSEGGRVKLQPVAELAPLDMTVPADISSAAFFLVGASIAEGSRLTLTDVGMNPTRTGILDILDAMGARVARQREREVGGEPVADLEVCSANLSGIDIPVEWVPRAIDEFPAVFVAAACADGTTRIRGAKELRVKESDRISVMARALASLGVQLEERPDGVDIVGGGIRGGTVDAAGDHRCAMSLAMAALAGEAPIEIRGSREIATSFPDFVELAAAVGLAVEAGR